ncbi:MAG: nuclear transport factor 2 family protein [Phycisphaeraceae bacterium]|nr:MAG: nuclear transport factor 2 family protein [Phycisphaeraceae bacterium]
MHNVGELLDAWHAAAAHGDFDAYFSRMTPNAVFLGTDESERWTREQFEDFARPYFDGEEAWTYRVLERHVRPWRVSTNKDKPAVAWADEILDNDHYGHCRGTAVLVRGEDGAWRIDQYSLTFLVPNDAAPRVVELIRSTDK